MNHPRLQIEQDVDEVRVETGQQVTRSTPGWATLGAVLLLIGLIGAGMGAVFGWTPAYLLLGMLAFVGALVTLGAVRTHRIRMRWTATRLWVPGHRLSWDEVRAVELKEHPPRVRVRWATRDRALQVDLGAGLPSEDVRTLHGLLRKAWHARLGRSATASTEDLRELERLRGSAGADPRP